MNWHDKRVKYVLIGSFIVLGIIVFQIVNKLVVASNKAKSVTGKAAVQVATTFPTRGTINPVVKLSGSLDPVWQADIAAKVSGRVSKVFVDVGSQVVAGQVLASLDPGELVATANSAQGSVYDARANLAQAETTLERYQKLYANGAISQQALDNAKFTRDMAAGKLASSQGTYENAASKLEGTDVITPQGGTVVKRNFQEGYYANAGTALFNIADTTSLILKINIPEGQIGSVALGTTCDVVIPAMNDKKVQGTITKLAQVADLPARTFAAEVTVDNRDNSLRGGLYANVSLQSMPKDNVLIIPQAAIVMREDQRTVYVVDNNGKVSRKVLTTGYIGDGKVEVLNGLTEQDQIIIAGQNRVREGSVVIPQKDGQ